MKKYFKIFILILVLAFTCVLTGCKTPVNDVGDTINDLIVEKGEERGIRLSKRNVKNDDGSYTITATVTPTSISHVSLVWVLQWTDEGDDSPYDFITLDISSDTLSCDLRMLEPFDYTINLCVYSKRNDEIFSTCLLHCFERLDDCTINVKDSFGSQPDLVNGEYDFTYFTYEDIFVGREDLGGDRIYLRFPNLTKESNFTFIGTVPCVYSYEMTICWDGGELAQGCDYYGEDFDKVFGTQVYSLSSVLSDDGKFYISDFIDGSTNPEYKDFIINLLSECNSWFIVKVNYIVYDGASGDNVIQNGFKTFNLLFNIDIADITEITLSQSDLFF